MMPVRKRVAPDPGAGNDQSAARSTTHFSSDGGELMARPTPTCALPPPGGTANTRSRRAPSVSSNCRAAHSHDSMSTLWLTTTAHSSAVQNRGRGAPAGSSRPGWLCAHEDANATAAYSHARLGPRATDATYQVCSPVGDLPSSSSG